MADLFTRLPKAELHVHLEGCLEPEQILRFAERNRIAIKHRTVESIIEANRFSGLNAFVEVMSRNSSAIRTGQDIYDIAYGYLQRAHDDNIVHAELAFSPQGPVQRGIKYEDVFEGIVAAFEDGRAEFGISGGPILACLRNRPPTEAYHMITTYGPIYGDGILALGLHGPEKGFPPAPFARCFGLARSFGWKTVAHAGEDGPADYIRQALDALEVDRIDHGVRCDWDDELVERLREAGTPLTVCPLSNVHLRVFDSLADHNFARLLDAGLNVSLHTDDPAYFDGYLSKHFRILSEAGLLTSDRLIRLQINAFASAFMPPSEKSHYQNMSKSMIEEDRSDPEIVVM